jgi:hypothetical protein
VVLRREDVVSLPVTLFRLRSARTDEHVRDFMRVTEAFRAMAAARARGPTGHARPDALP